MAETVLRGAVVDGRIQDVHIDDGTITAVTDPLPSSTPQPSRELGRVDVDLAGFVLLPSAVEPHAHLDKAFLADVLENPAGDLTGAIEAVHAHHTSMSAPDTTERAVRAGLLMAGNGYTGIRTHVDVTTGSRLVALEAVVEARRRLAGTVDLEIVALCGSPVTGAAAADQRALLDDALDTGADLVGGCPHLEPDGARAATEYLLSVAADHGVGVDLHTDETLDPHVLGVRDLIAGVDAGFPHRVTASHCVSLGVLPEHEQRQIADDLARTGIGVVTNPHTNLYLQARSSTTAPPRGLTAVGVLADAGVALAAGQDNIQDPFNPLGRGDPFEVAALVVLAAHRNPQEAYATVSSGARTVLGLPPVSVAPGAPADLLAVRATSLRAAIAFSPAADNGRLVFRRGQLVNSMRP